MRQLRLSNIFMGIMLFFVFITFAVMGFLLWTVLTFTNDIRERVDAIQTRTEESLDIKSDICSEPNLRNFIGDSSFCTDGNTAN